MGRPRRVHHGGPWYYERVEGDTQTRRGRFASNADAKRAAQQETSDKLLWKWVKGEEIATFTRGHFRIGSI